MAEDTTVQDTMQDEKPVSAKNAPVQSVDKKYVVTFKYNRSFDLTIGNKFYHFEPSESKDIFTDVDINHPDFKQQQDYFSVREI